MRTTPTERTKARGRYSFPGKEGLVTRGSGGRGAATLEASAAAGTPCVVNYFADPAGENRRDAEQTAAKLRAHNVPVHVFDADVSDYEQVRRLMQRVVEGA